MIWVYKECGSKEVEQLSWVDLNTDEVLDGTGNYSIEENWCRNCEAHVEIEYKKDQED